LASARVARCIAVSSARVSIEGVLDTPGADWHGVVDTHADHNGVSDTHVLTERGCMMTMASARVARCIAVSSARIEGKC